MSCSSVPGSGPSRPRPGREQLDVRRSAEGLCAPVGPDGAPPGGARQPHVQRRRRLRTERSELPNDLCQFCCLKGPTCLQLVKKIALSMRDTWVQGPCAAGNAENKNGFPNPAFSKLRSPLNVLVNYFSLLLSLYGCADFHSTSFTLILCFLCRL